MYFPWISTLEESHRKSCQMELERRAEGRSASQMVNVPVIGQYQYFGNSSTNLDVYLGPNLRNEVDLIYCPR
jgi:hypothetical protein